MAAEKGNVLNPSDIQQLLQLPPTVAKEVLSQKLGIPPYLDTEDLQKAPFITYIYDSVIFAAEKGFPWDHITLVVKFAHHFLKGILVEKHQLPDALRDFKKKSTLLEPLSDRHKKQYVDFVFETVLCHYHLYKYVFSRLRDTVKPKINLEVSTPPIPLPLSEGQSVNVWEYQQRLKAVENKEAEAQEKRRDLEMKKGDRVEHKTLTDLNGVPLPYSKMTLEELVKDVLKGYSEKKERELKSTASEMVEDLSFKLEKTAVPRPVALGSPPRFKPKSPTTGKKSSNNNALKPEKGSSARSEKSRSGRASNASGKSKR